MKNQTLLFLLSVSLLTPFSLSNASTRRANMIVLDATGAQNLRIETAVVEPGDFEETVFALGRIEAKPGSVAAVTSRISGRVVALSAFVGDRVVADAEVLKVESRQIGNPSPVIASRAPLSGVVTRVDVRLGDPVEPDRALMEITDLSEVVAVARVPENLAGLIKAEAVAHISISALPEAKFTGRLLRLGTAVDQTSGTLDAIFILSNPDGAIRPGMRSEFSIIINKRTNVTTVPRSALQGTPTNRFLYVKDFDLPNAFVKTHVVVGQSNDRHVEILSGLLPSDEVVTNGAYSLAFAGGGSVSLKEALDAAHGHEHNEDGSEITAEQRKNAAAKKSGDTHDHGHSSPFWMIVSGVLFVALLFVAFRKKPDAPAKKT